MLFCFQVVIIISLNFDMILKHSFLLMETYVSFSKKRDFSSSKFYDVLQNQFEFSIP